MVKYMDRARGLPFLELDLKEKHSLSSHKFSPRHGTMKLPDYQLLSRQQFLRYCQCFTRRPAIHPWSCFVAPVTRRAGLKTAEP